MQQPSDYFYELPEDLIAKHPLEDRAASRLLVVNRAQQKFTDHHFRDLPGFLRTGDCLVVNNTKVIPARLFGQRPGTTGKIEILLVRKLPTPNHWEALVRPGRKLSQGTVVEVGEQLVAEIVGVGEAGLREVKLLMRNGGMRSGSDVEEEIERIGHVPLPPYLQRPDSPADRSRYQTVFARHAGSAAAPTAGLHFTPE
ncbi:MAG: S-adenosylmethionine:tRNA ribosyltransferase-isomerase, partial [Bryobacter sp.]|nr:S-adenosylmethionine:tRNA ribosyltransferase-isomerase [Bryobacter sp.]